MNRRGFLRSAPGTTALAMLSTSAAVAAPDPERRRILVPVLSADHLDELSSAAPNLELVPCANQREALARVEHAAASYGFISPELVAKGKGLQWLQQASAGVETIVYTPELQASPAILTNMQRAYAPEIADQALGYLLCFTRQLRHFVRTTQRGEWAARGPTPLEELAGKTLLIVGLGGIGTEIARRAAGFGMRVIATDPKVLERPLFVAELHRPAALDGLLPSADVVASAAPLTPLTRKLFDASAFSRMKRGVVFINVSRGGLCETDALVAALDGGQVSAAGLDVTDPEPLPAGHPLWSRNVIITPHSAGQSPGGERRRHELFKENLGRFARGEMLLNIVDKKVGY